MKNPTINTIEQFKVFYQPYFNDTMLHILTIHDNISVSFKRTQHEPNSLKALRCN